MFMSLGGESEEEVNEGTVQITGQQTDLGLDLAWMISQLTGRDERL